MTARVDLMARVYAGPQMPNLKAQALPSPQSSPTSISADTETMIDPATLPKQVLTEEKKDDVMTLASQMTNEATTKAIAAALSTAPIIAAPMAASPRPSVPSIHRPVEQPNNLLPGARPSVVLRGHRGEPCEVAALPLAVARAAVKAQWADWQHVEEEEAVDIGDDNATDRCSGSTQSSGLTHTQPVRPGSPYPRSSEPQPERKASNRRFSISKMFSGQRGPKSERT